MDKRCNRCKEVKPLEFFGKRSMCKACNNVASKAYYKANLEKVKAAKKAYYEANSEKVRAANNAWKEANPDKVKAWREANPDKVKAWREANPDRYAALLGKGLAIRRGGSVSDTYDLELCIAFYSESRRLTRETGTPHEVDHIIPIAKGGLHCQTNLQVLTAKENREKWDNL